MQQLTLFDVPTLPEVTPVQETPSEAISTPETVQDVPHSDYVDVYASTRGIHPTYRTITMDGNTLLFAQHNGYNYFVDKFADRPQAEAIRDRLNEDAEVIRKRRGKRVKRLAPLTEEGWNALPERPHVWYEGKLREMRWDEQVRG